MLTKTYLTGKTDYLESSLERMNRALQRHGFRLEFSQWLNPTPYIHSVHVKERDCPALFANGKGISEKAAQASAMGEFIERLGSHYLFADYYLGQTPSGFLMHPQELRLPLAAFNKSQLLTPHLWQLYDLEQQVTPEQLVALQDGGECITAIPLTPISGGESVYFPINLLNSLYASNGLAAGNSLLEAAVQGLSEVLERWVRIQILKNSWCLPRLPKTVWQSFTTVVEAMDKLALQGIRCDVRDASLGGKYPVIAIILTDSDDGRSFVSFGSHPILEVAIERTLTESLQGRQVSERDGFDYPLADQDLVASEENCEMHFIDASGRWHLGFFADEADFEPAICNTSGSIEDQWHYLCNVVEAVGYSVYWQHHAQLGLHVVRLVVPGMSEIYPMTDLLDGNANRGLLLRDALHALDWQKDRSFEHLLDLVEAEGYSAHTRVASLIGLLADAGSPWSWLTIAELKLGCLLYLGDFQAAQTCLSEVFAVGRQAPEYQALALALALMQGDQRDQQMSALINLFGEERWQAVIDWIEGSCFIWDIELIDAERFSARHQALLRAHQRMNLAMMALNNS